MSLLASRWDTIDGTRYHVRVSTRGQGKPPVVLVHGFVISSRYLMPLARELAPHMRVLAPDLPGFGRSDKPPCVLNVAELADALARWIEHAGLAGAPLLGNSFGCQVIVELAVRRPDLVPRAVLVGPTMDPGAGAVQQALRLLADVPREKPKLWVEHVPDYVRAGLPRALATYRHALAHPMRERLPRVQAPVLVVRGSHDPIVSPAWAEECARRLPRGELLVLPGPHVLNYTRPAELAAAVLPFLLDGEPPPQVSSRAAR